jgi:CDGSH-type Zn-finger protein
MTPAARITPYRDGPILVRGAFSLTDQDGNVIPLHQRTVALCRCGRSSRKPFCDGTHKAIGFKAGTARDVPAPRAHDSNDDSPASHLSST